MNNNKTIDLIPDDILIRSILVTDDRAITLFSDKENLMRIMH